MKVERIMHKTIIIPLAFMLTLVLASCEINSSDNGDLDNWWWLRQVENIETGDKEDYVEKKVFWSYIGHLMQTDGGGSYTYQDEDGKTKKATCARLLFRFEHKGNTLRVYEPHYHNKSKGDPLLDPSIEADSRVIEKSLPIQGINLKQADDGTLEETFTVEHLDGDRMTLVNQDNTLRLYFIAY